MNKSKYIDELMNLHIKSLKERGISFNDKSLTLYRNMMEKEPVERIQREIALKLNPVTAEERQKMHLDRAEKQRLEKEMAVQRRESEARWKKEHEERRAKFNFGDCVPFQKLSTGMLVDGQAIVKEIKKNGDLILNMVEIGFFGRHMILGKDYTFEYHENFCLEEATWSLKAEEHECYEETIYGGHHGDDCLLVYMDDQFIFDLDS